MCYPCKLCNKCGKVTAITSFKRRCPSCGKAALDSERTCRACGAKLPPATPAPPGRLAKQPG